MSILLNHSSSRSSINQYSLFHQSNSIFHNHGFYYSTTLHRNSSYPPKYISLYLISDPLHTILHRNYHQPIFLLLIHAAHHLPTHHHNKHHLVILIHHIREPYYSSINPYKLRHQYDEMSPLR